MTASQEKPMTPLTRSLAVLAFSVFPLLAQPGVEMPGPGSGLGSGPRGGRMARALDLTEAQKSSIHAIHEKHRPEMAARRETARQAQTALQTAFREAATPEAQLRALHDKASAARFEMMLAGRSIRQEVDAVLTPEQRAKAADLRGTAQAHRRERMHHLRKAAGMTS